MPEWSEVLRLTSWGRRLQGTKVTEHLAGAHGLGSGLLICPPGISQTLCPRCCDLFNLLAAGKDPGCIYDGRFGIQKHKWDRNPDRAQAHMLSVLGGAWGRRAAEKQAQAWPPRRRNDSKNPSPPCSRSLAPHPVTIRMTPHSTSQVSTFQEKGALIQRQTWNPPSYTFASAAGFLELQGWTEPWH